MSFKDLNVTYRILKDYIKPKYLLIINRLKLLNGK